MSTYATPIPGVAQYGQAALAAKTAYQQALARINQRRGSTLRTAGFQGDINQETGVVQNIRVDPLNPYGHLQMLNRSQAERDEAAQWAGIERGLGAGGGLAAQMRNRQRFSFGQEDAALGQSLTSALGSLQDEQNQAAYARDAALYQAELDALRFAIQEGMFNPADVSDMTTPEYGSTVPNYVRATTLNPGLSFAGPGAGGPRLMPKPKAAAKPAPKPAAKPILPHTKSTFRPTPAPAKKKK